MANSRSSLRTLCYSKSLDGSSSRSFIASSSHAMLLSVSAVERPKALSSSSLSTCCSSPRVILFPPKNSKTCHSLNRRLAQLADSAKSPPVYFLKITRGEALGARAVDNSSVAVRQRLRLPAVEQCKYRNRFHIGSGLEQRRQSMPLPRQEAY